MSTNKGAFVVGHKYQTTDGKRHTFKVDDVVEGVAQATESVMEGRKLAAKAGKLAGMSVANHARESFRDAYKRTRERELPEDYRQALAGLKARGADRDTSAYDAWLDSL